MTHEIKIQPEYYEKIKQGTKIYEVRLFDEKRQAYRIGDTLIVKKEPELMESICVTITDLIHFKTFTDMAKKITPAEIGFNNTNSIQEIVDVYHKFYTESQETSLGVLAIKVQI